MGTWSIVIYNYCILTIHLQVWQDSKACHPNGQYWHNYPGALSLSEVTAIHLNIGHP